MSTGSSYNIKKIQLLLFLMLFAGGVAESKAQPSQQNDSSSVHSVSEFYNQHQISQDRAGLNEYSFWGGYSFHSSNGVWGQTSGATLSVFGFRYNRKLLTFPKHYLLKYVAEMNVHVQYHLSAISTQETAPSSLSGFGMTPLGFQFNALQNHTVKPFFKSSAGFMYLTEPFPDDRGTNFNFTLEIGTGIDIELTRNSFFTIGYKYHHMSNGQFGQINPGVDSNMFYAGITFF